MTSQRRRTGRPAHGSRGKLVAAACELFAERGFTATSPTMVLDRSGVGHGSLYHYFDGKEALALAAIEQMRADLMAKLGLENSEDRDCEADAENSGTTGIDAILDVYFGRTEGRALLHLLTDPTIGESPTLSQQVRAWCDDLRAAIEASITGDSAEGSTDDVSSGRLPEVADPHLAAALGRGLLAMPHKVDLLHPADPR
ncbi:TetR/AcrR family transcriptional regulator [Acidipropionibacterium jensenii]|uniref:TetR/AcrR family transcriptional regulator n=1 Tax=Acidipropionibacterium jensenii TaxID=1749 RepID=UPI001586C070|nr:TetR/AcrR family transcriptional regulator [Acidipropionibacterium jensenii]